MGVDVAPGAQGVVGVVPSHEGGRDHSSLTEAPTAVSVLETVPPSLETSAGNAGIRHQHHRHLVSRGADHRWQLRPAQLVLLAGAPVGARPLPPSRPAEHLQQSCQAIGQKNTERNQSGSIFFIVRTHLSTNDKD